MIIQFLKECLERSLWQNAVGRSIIKGQLVRIVQYKGGAIDENYVIIVCYLPKDEDLFKYWDDAYDIDSIETDEIMYTDRFKKPDWLN